VSPAEPMIIGTRSLREASSMCSRSWTCHARGLVEVSVPSGIGPTSSLPESAAMMSGRASTPRRKLSTRIGANPRWPFGQMTRSESIRSGGLIESIIAERDGVPECA
jgi:hypothetical protein